MSQRILPLASSGTPARAIDALATKLSPRILRAPQRLDQAAREIDQYFAGARKSFDLSLDFSLSRGFRQGGAALPHRDRLRADAMLCRGGPTRGNPKAVRAVGTACGTNPMPVVVPCHRVLRTDGTLGGYLDGLPTKTLLLKLEGAM